MTFVKRPPTSIHREGTPKGVFGTKENVFHRKCSLRKYFPIYFLVFGKVSRKYCLKNIYIYNQGNTKRGVGGRGLWWWVWDRCVGGWRGVECQLWNLFSLLPLGKLFSLFLSNLFSYRKYFPKFFTNQVREIFLKNGFLPTKYTPRMRRRSLVYGRKGSSLSLDGIIYL